MHEYTFVVVFSNGAEIDVSIMNKFSSFDARIGCWESLTPDQQNCVESIDLVEVKEIK